MTGPTTPTGLPGHVEQLSPGIEVAFEGAHWYELSGPEHFWMHWRLQEALRLTTRIGLEHDAKLRVLDVGGGIGTVRHQLEAATSWTVDLGELDGTALRQGQPGRGRTLQYDILERHPGFEGAYDVVVLFDVLEHIQHTDAFLQALVWHLRVGGHLLINVPALPSGHSRYDDAAGHVRRYTKATLPAALPRDSIEVVDLRYWGMGLLPLLFARKAWLQTVARNQSRDETLRRGFQAPGPIGSGLLSLLMKAEQATAAGVPLGTSLLLAARRRR